MSSIAKPPQALTLSPLLWACGWLAALFSQGSLSQVPLSIPVHALESSVDRSVSHRPAQKTPKTLAKKSSPVAPAPLAHIPNAYELGLAKPYDPSSASMVPPPASPTLAASPIGAPLSYKQPGSVDTAANTASVLTFTPVTHVVVTAPAANGSNPMQNQAQSQNLKQGGDPLMAIASQIQTGHFPCELGQSIDLREVSSEMGHYDLILKGHVYSMVPMVSQTGAIMIEDPKAGMKWIQLSNKSMLLNSKLGQRLVDDCQSPSQVQEARNQKLHPPQHLLAPKGESQYTINVVN